MSSALLQLQLQPCEVVSYFVLCVLVGGAVGYLLARFLNRRDEKKLRRSTDPK